MVTEEVPYSEESLGNNLYLRTFSENTPDTELKWHWDEEDRTISLVHIGQVQETDWMFQMDNELPKKIEESIFIPAGKWHRLIRGTRNLTLRIEKRPLKSVYSMDGKQQD